MVATLREDQSLRLYRRRQPGADEAVLVLAPAADQPSASVLSRLAHEYALTPELDASWAAKPLMLERGNGHTTLILHDFGGDPLDLGPPASPNLARFLSLATRVSAKVREMHARGLIHRDLKPANILVDGRGDVRLTGFGMASRASRDRDAQKPPEVIVGTFAYMAPEQTGRIDRAVDMRSDLYSLGVTLYEMLTGSLPFNAVDPSEWIHCHVAKAPVKPSERVQGIPQPVEAIILKLLEKAPEDRYQTAAGVEADLRVCLLAWSAHERIEPFSLGLREPSSQLLLPERIYGRQAELQSLIAAFERVKEGSTERILLAGPAGIGKSFLFNELRKRIARQGILVAVGKAEQQGRDIPYAALAQALQSVVRQLLGKDDEEVGRWRAALLAALGTNGQLMVNLIPQLELVIGEQPALPELPPHDAQSRFQLAFRQLLGVFAQPDHPLLLFLDDMQWMDPASFELLERTAAEPAASYVLVIGAYRDDEVHPGHPLTRTLAAVTDARGPIQKLRLRPLEPADIGQLIAEAVDADGPRALPLAQLTFEKTGGNPLFTTQFLIALAEEGLLAFDAKSSAWDWDLDRIRAKSITDNVAELLASKLSRRPHALLELVTCLACAGTDVDGATLALILDRSQEQIDPLLQEALRAGFVVCLGGAYSLVHDRVEDAACALISSHDRANIHLKIARVLSSHPPRSPLEERVFEIATHFNLGAGLIHDSVEREQAATFNRAAGKRAKSSTAYAAALTYFAAADALLPSERWEHGHRLAFDVELGRAECEFLTGEPLHAEARLSALSKRAVEAVDRAAVARLRIALLTTLHRFDDAIEVGADYCRHVGIEWPAHPTEADLRRERERLWTLLDGRQIVQLLDLPLMVDPERRATMDVLGELFTPTTSSNRDLCRLLVLLMTNLSVEHGNCDASCSAYALLNLVLDHSAGDYETGWRFGELALALVEKRGLDRFKARVFLFVGVLVTPWTQELGVSRELMRRAVEAANAVGDITFALICSRDVLTNLMTAGEPLDEIQREAEQGLALARKTGFELVIDVFIGQLWLIRMLRGVPVDQGSDPAISELELEQRLDEGPQLRVAACLYWIQKVQARYWLGDYAGASGASSRARDLLADLSPTLELADYHFYAALSCAATCDRATSSEERAPHLEMLAAHYQQIAIWAKNCAPTFGNRRALVAAEIARIERRELDAEQLYEEAIRSARTHGFVQNEGLASELAARFQAQRGLATIAEAYFATARSCYARWGAGFKARQLDAEQGFVESSAGSEATIGTPVERLDLAAMVKVSEAISGEIDQRRLFDALMLIAIEHAGADRGLLLLPSDGDLRIEAEATAKEGAVNVQLRAAPIDGAVLPESILRYVVRTQDAVLINDAGKDAAFSADEYLAVQRCKSVLCLPLIKQTRLVGVLYLENRQAAHVFTPARLSVLNLLASQAAIALENARLFAELRRAQAYVTDAQRLMNTGSYSYNTATGELSCSPEMRRINELDVGAKVSIEACFERIHPEDRESVRHVMRHRWGHGETFESDYRLVTQDGSLKYIHSVGRAAVDAAGTLSISGTAMDVTASKVAQLKLQASLRELSRVARLTTIGELTVSIAHEVNQPLMSIVTNAAACARWLAEGNLNVEEARSAAERIVREGHRAGDILESIRALTRKSSSVISSVNLNAVINEVLELMRAELRERQISVETALQADLMPINGDRIQLQQVMLNLIKNAAESMAVTHGRARALRVSSRVDPGRQLLVCVTDTGPGIDPDAMSQIFEAFFTTKADGIGLGLSICRSIVEAHRGHLWAKPNFPHGSAFQFSLPLAQ